MVNWGLAILVPAFPLLGALVIAALRRRLGANAAGGLGTLMVMASFLVSLILFISHITPPILTVGSGIANWEPSAHIVKLADWINVAGMSIPFAFQIDALSLTMMLIVTGVGSLIHLYSVGYMHDDKRVASFFAMLNLFTFAMLLLVMGANYLITFIGWEGVGLCSYLLIGFWYTTPEYNYAARKAFVMNRIGDVGVVLGLALLFHRFGTLDYQGIFAQLGGISLGDPLIVGATLLLFVGAMGKSAQIPLFTWLPDAMAGPTPVSALIHAATMVTAGIFLIVRSSVLFELAPFTKDLILIIGTATALLAASIGLFQNDIKKVLAYSTVSQLGYMFAALGLGAYSAGMFHVTTHAFFKALLFLGAGSVIHALGGEQDIRRMGGLKGATRTTYATFLIGTIAIAGIPPFSGFFSKDSILANAYAHSPVVYALLLLGAVLTAFYMFRLLFLVFFGSYRGNAHPHESPAVITIPLIVLAVLSIGGGLLNLPHLFGGHEPMAHYLATAADGIHGEHLQLEASTEWALMGLSTGLVLLTIWFAYTRFVKTVTLDGEPADMPFFKRLIANKWKIDELYAALFEKPFGWLSTTFFTFGENKVMVPLMNGFGNMTLRAGKVVRRLQTGNASFYLFAMVAGIIVFLLLTLYGA